MHELREGFLNVLARTYLTNQPEIHKQNERDQPNRQMKIWTLFLVSMVAMTGVQTEHKQFAEADFT